MPPGRGAFPGATGEAGLMWAALTFGGLDWLWPVAGAAGLAWVTLAWSYRVGPPGPLRPVCAGLKALAVAALALCLLDPLRSDSRARPGANLFAVVADNSQGLAIKDRGESRTRGEQLQAMLGPEGGEWLNLLEAQFEVRRFTFDTRLNATRDFRELNFNGRATSLGGALGNLAERFQGRPLAGVLLFTDGNATDLPQGVPSGYGGLPVYPVVLGRPGAARDLALAQVQVSQTAFEDAPVTVQAEVDAHGWRGEDVVAVLTAADGRRLESQSERVRKDADRLVFRFRWRPDQPGLSFYRVEVAAQRDLARPAGGDSLEATELNNRRVVAVDRGRGPYRVLYVAGRPNWEFKFLKRALQEDPEIELVGLIRVALREPKFTFQGRAGETGNPLFRGFGDQSREEVERYDQPVLIRLDVRDEQELRAGFPRTAEDLYRYHAVVLDDVEAAFFDPDQANLLQKFVSERGGGLLMLGGAESFQEGQYQRTPIGDVLPVTLDRVSDRPAAGGVKMELSAEGWLQAWARVRENEQDESARREQAPPFEVFNPVREAKPGASVLATAVDGRGREFPALVTQRFGRGRSAVLTVGDFWRWGMRDAEAHRDMDKAWRQLVRWLVADVPKPVELLVHTAAGDPDGAVELQVRVRDAAFQPVDDAAVSVEIQPVMTGAGSGATNSLRLTAEPAADEAGLYQVAYVPRHTGGYRVLATVTNAVGAELGRAETGWSTDLAAAEFASLEPNLVLLETLAGRTHGEVVPAEALGDFVRRLPERRAPVMDAWIRPAWHTPWMFAFALCCLVAEWGLRRWKGMP